MPSCEMLGIQRINVPLQVGHFCCSGTLGSRRRAELWNRHNFDVKGYPTPTVFNETLYFKEGGIVVITVLTVSLLTFRTTDVI